MISGRLILRGSQTFNRCPVGKKTPNKQVTAKNVGMPILLLVAAVIGQALDDIHENKIDLQIHKFNSN